MRLSFYRRTGVYTATWGGDDFISGLVPMQSSGSVRILGKGAAFHRDFDPFSTIPGMAYPGATATEVTNSSVVDAVMIDCQINVGGTYAYGLAGSKLHRFDVLSELITNVGSFPHTITGAGAHAAHTTFSGALGSVCIYNVAGNSRIFYTWNDGADWDVGMTDETNFTDNFMSATPATPLVGTDLTDGVGKVHAMYVSQNDALMYISSGRYVHAFDGATGANGTFNAKVFTVKVGYDVVGFAETGYDLVLFLTNNSRTGRRGDAKAYFYGADRSADPYKQIGLDDDEVSAPFNFLGTIGCFTRNRNTNRSVLRLYDGIRFSPKFYWAGGLPTVGGVEIQDNLIKWNSDGILYAYGQKDGEFPTTKYQPTRTLGSVSGFLKSFISGNLYSSGYDGSFGNFNKFSGYNSATFWQGQTLFPGFFTGKKGIISSISIQFAQTVSGGRALDLQLLTKSGGIITTVISGVTTIDGNNISKDFYIDSSGNRLPTFTNLKPILIWSAGLGSTSAPGVKSVTVTFKSVNQLA